MTELAVILLNYLKAHPNLTTRETERYQNTVTFAVSDNLILPQQADLFPDDKLAVVRLAHWFLTDQPELMAWLGNLIDPDQVFDPDSVWLTTAHLTQRKQLYIEISFE
ncbi:hypothetical protein [Lacticaseibacillus saniviri]